MKSALIFFTLLFVSNLCSGQKTWIRRGMVPYDTIKNIDQLGGKCILYIDLNKTVNYADMITSKGPFYLWFFQPLVLPDNDPHTNGFGIKPWANSNELLKMTPFDTTNGKRIWKYDFDNITPFVYFHLNQNNGDINLFNTHGLCFLVKPKDGGGYGFADHKTEDLCLGNFKWLTGISDTSNESITIDIYPNPINNQLNITSNTDQIINFRVQNYIGETMFEGPIKSAETSVDMNDLPNGMYIITFLTKDNQFIVRKFFKE